MDTYEFTLMELVLLITAFTLSFGLIVYVAVLKGNKDSFKVANDMKRAVSAMSYRPEAVYKLLDDVSEPIGLAVWHLLMYRYIAQATHSHTLKRVWITFQSHAGLDDYYLSRTFFERWQSLTREELRKAVADKHANMILMVIENAGSIDPYVVEALRSAIGFASSDADRDKILNDFLLKRDEYAELWYDFAKTENSPRRLHIIAASTPEECPASECALEKLEMAKELSQV